MTEAITGKRIGRKQLIACVFGATPYLMNYALVWAGKLDGAAFWGSTWVYVSGFLAVLLGAAAIASRKPAAE